MFDHSSFFFHAREILVNAVNPLLKPRPRPSFISPSLLILHHQIANLLPLSAPPAPGGVLPCMGYIGMCRCEGYGFQAVYSGIGYINQSVWV